MVKICCEVIDREMIEVARMIANSQKDVVTIIAPTETMEVRCDVSVQQDVGR